jgi:hypothetical protein
MKQPARRGGGRQQRPRSLGQPHQRPARRGGTRAATSNEHRTLRIVQRRQQIRQCLRGARDRLTGEVRRGVRQRQLGLIDCLVLHVERKVEQYSAALRGGAAIRVADLGDRRGGGRHALRDRTHGVRQAHLIDPEVRTLVGCLARHHQ